jgi:predicted acetyltransferase
MLARMAEAVSNGDIEVRPARPDEYRTASDTMRAALLTQPIDDKDWDKAREGWEDHHTAITAWDGARCVGHAGAFHMTTRVPGGAKVQAAGVTRVGVLPTHRRRGILTRMMRQLLDTSLADGRAIANLRASEAVIYGRYGFGVAGTAIELKIDSRRLRPLRGAAKGSFRLIPATEVLDVLPPLYERVATRSGTVDRLPFLWKRYLDAVIEASKPHFVAVHTAPDGTDDGYVHYSVSWGDTPDGSENKAEVLDMYGTTGATELALWAYVADLDLVRVIASEVRPVDDPLLLAAHDRRGVHVQNQWDEQWVRLLDVETALRARTYADSRPVTIAVSDPWFAANNDTFRVGAGEVSRAGESPDLRADIATISAAYLGGTKWYDLWAAGHLTAGDEAAARRADALFAVSPAPFCGSFY